MKERTREALFNRLGSSIQGTYAIDLFAGTGALGLEALSRGAAMVTCVEIHRRHAENLRRNVRLLGVEDRVQVTQADAFRWIQAWQTRDPQGEFPTCIFVCPPYELFVTREDEMLNLIRVAVDRSPADSLVVVESPLEWDQHQLPFSEAWDARDYAPARVSILVTPGPQSGDPREAIEG